MTTDRYTRMIPTKATLRCQEENVVALKWAEKPPRGILDIVRQHGFKWSYAQQVWFLPISSMPRESDDFARTLVVDGIMRKIEEYKSGQTTPSSSSSMAQGFAMGSAPGDANVIKAESSGAFTFGPPPEARTEPKMFATGYTSPYDRSQPTIVAEPTPEPEPPWEHCAKKQAEQLANQRQRNDVLQADNTLLLARIEHLEGYVEVLKKEAAPSAVAAAKPKTKVVIRCQNDEDY
jgi:hypothetical protein